MAVSWLSKFQIALASNGVNALRPLSELIIAEPNRAPYAPYLRVAGKNGLGENITIGFPFARWEFDWLPQTDIDVLRQFEAQDVLIQTETDTGVPRAFRVFACYLQPFTLGEIDRRIGYDGADGLRQKRSLVMEFSTLVEV